MRRLFIGSASLALGMMLVAAPAAAQFFVGGGITSRTGDQGDDLKMGWMATGGVSPWATSNGQVRIWVEGMFGQNNAEDVDAKSTLKAGLASVVYNITQDNSVNPYLIGSVGYYHEKQEFDGDTESEGGIGYGVGAGVGVGDFYIEARMLTAKIVDDLSSGFFGVFAGYAF